MPFGAASYGDTELRYLTVEQALADMTDLLFRRSELFGCPGDVNSGTSPHCKAVLFGGSVLQLASSFSSPTTGRILNPDIFPSFAIAPPPLVRLR